MSVFDSGVKFNIDILLNINLQTMSLFFLRKPNAKFKTKDLRYKHEIVFSFGLIEKKGRSLK